MPSQESGVRVLFDISAVRHGIRNGTAIYAYRLARSLLMLRDGTDLVLYFGARRSLESEEVLDELTALGARVVHGAVPWNWSPDGAWWLPVRPPLQRILGGVDVFHIGEFHLPGKTAVPTVATVHDLTTILLPEQHTLLNRLVHQRRLRWIERRADQVISISECTRRDLLKRYRIDPARVHVVHHARAQGGEEIRVNGGLIGAVRNRFGIGERPYILIVGTIEPRKNHLRLVHAFESMPERFGNVRLVIAGGRGWRAEPILEGIESSPARERIHLVGSVSSEELMALYAGAKIFAFPSNYEGFGLPLLEAMAAGVPVLTSNVSSLPEVAGDAAHFVDPDSVDSIRSGLEVLLADAGLREQLIARGRAREREFTWRRTAEATRDVYLRASESR